MTPAVTYKAKRSGAWSSSSTEAVADKVDEVVVGDLDKGDVEEVLLGDPVMMHSSFSYVQLAPLDKHCSSSPQMQLVSHFVDVHWPSTYWQSMFATH